MKQQEQIVRADGHEVKISRPGKVLFPDDGITKGDLIRYYQRIGSRMLPFLEGRPLALERFPDGIDQPGFFQKEAKHFPHWVRKAAMKKTGGSVCHAICEDTATLVYLANLACVPHTWLSRADQADTPDQMIFDFDPSGDDFRAVCEGAQSLKHILDDLGLPCYLKTTGSRGLHVIVPLERQDDFNSVRAFARTLAEIVVAQDRRHLTLEQYKNKRRGRVFVDTNRNAYAQTAVAPFAVRARPGAPVALPVAWSDLRRKDFRSDGVTIRSIFDYVEGREDPWKHIWRSAVTLDRARRKLEKKHAA